MTTFICSRFWAALLLGGVCCVGVCRADVLMWKNGELCDDANGGSLAGSCSGQVRLHLDLSAGEFINLAEFPDRLELALSGTGGMFSNVGTIASREGAAAQLVVSGSTLLNDKGASDIGRIGAGNGNGLVELEVSGQGVLENRGEMGVGVEREGKVVRGSVSLVLKGTGSVCNSGIIGGGSGGEASIAVRGGELVNRGTIGGASESGVGRVHMEVSAGRVINEGGSIGSLGKEGDVTKTVSGSGRAVIEISGGEFINRGWLGSSVGGMLSFGKRATGSVEIHVSGGVYEQQAGCVGYTEGYTEGEEGTEGGDSTEGGKSGGSARITITGHGRVEYSGGTYGDVEVEVRQQGVYSKGGLESAEHIVMRGGRLEGAGRHSGGVWIETEQNYRRALALGGLRGEQIERVVTGEGVRLTELGKGSKLTLHGSNEMVVGRESIAVGGGALQAAMIEYEGGSGSVAIAREGELKLHYAAGDIAGAWREGKRIAMKVWLTNGQIDMGLEELRERIRFGTGWNMWLSEVGVKGQQRGVLQIEGDLSGIWFSSDYVGKESEAPRFDAYSKVVVNRDIELEWDGAEGSESVMRQVEGSGELRITNRSGQQALTIIAENKDAGASYGETEMSGRVQLGAGVHLEKRGGAELRLSGGLEVGGELRVREGRLTLGEGKQHRVGRLGRVESGGELWVEGELAVSGGEMSGGGGRIGGGGRLRVEGELRLGDEVQVSGIGVEIGAGGELDVKGNKISVSELSGQGAVRMEGGRVRTSGEGEHSGELRGRGGRWELAAGARQVLSGGGNGGYELVVESGAALTLRGKAQGSVAYKSLAMESGSELSLEAGGRGSAARGGAGVEVSEGVVFRRGSLTNLVFNSESEEIWETGRALMLRTGGELSIEEGAVFNLTTLANSTADHESELRDIDNVLVMQGSRVQAQGGSELSIYRDGLLYLYYTDVSLEARGEGIYLSAHARSESPVYEGALTENARAGADMLEGADLSSDDTLGAVGEALGGMLKRGERERAARLLAALAGGTTTAASAAEAEQQREVLEAMLRRAEQAPLCRQSDRSESDARRSARLPRLQAWIEAEHGYARVKSRGDESGYTHSTWGGSVGADMGVGRGSARGRRAPSVGLALSAHYGDLTAQGAERLAGDSESRYLSLYAHGAGERWEHTLVLQAGSYSISQQREVDYGEGSYRAKSEAEGSSIAALYRVARTIRGRKGELRPYASVMVGQLKQKGYSESGAGGAGLQVGEQRQQVARVGLGVDWRRELSAQLSGRSSEVRLRVGVTQELSDESREAEVALQGNPGVRRQVKGSESGRTGLELGGSVSREVGKHGRVYLSGQLGARENTTTLFTTLGYQKTF